MRDNKPEVRAWYETHEKTLKETAEFWNIPYRTIKRWADDDGWVAGRALRGIDRDGLGAEVIGALADTQGRLRAQLGENLGETLIYAPAARRERLLDALSTEMIAEAMSTQFLNAQTITAALIVKNEVEGLLETSEGKKDALPIIAAAEKMQSMMIAAKKSIFGDVVQSQNGGKRGADLSAASDDELREMIDGDE